MSRPFIVMGDSTSHGGRVITADQTFLLEGKPLARVGDMVTCPRCKGVFPIQQGAPDMVTLERSPARHGDKTACGASLIAGQSLTTWSDESSMGDPAADAKAEALTAAASIASPAAGGICLDCLLKAAQLGSPAVIRE